MLGEKNIEKFYDETEEWISLSKFSCLVEIKKIEYKKSFIENVNKKLKVKNFITWFLKIRHLQYLQKCGKWKFNF